MAGLDSQAKGIFETTKGMCDMYIDLVKTQSIHREVLRYCIRKVGGG